LSERGTLLRNRTFGIDQICIDQANDLDKDRQIRLMGRIYSEALNVIIWLGPGDSETPLVYGLIEDVSKEVWSRMQSFPLASYHEQTNLRDNVDSKLSLSRDCTTWVAFRKWFSNPYFSRTWTVQEVVPASAFTTSV
jgi:hypothetical protein